MVVVAAGRQEQDVAGGTPARDVARLVDHVEAEHVDVERADPVDVGRAQVRVTDPHARIDRLGRSGDGLDRALRVAHRTNGDMIDRRATPTTLPRLRQAVVAAAQLEPTVERLQEELGLGEPYNDPAVGFFGLRNAVFALGDTFLEVVSPLSWTPRRTG